MSKLSEEKNKFIALYHFLDKPQDFNLEMNYYEFRDELKNLLNLYNKEKEKNKELKELIEQNLKYSHNLEKDLFENCSNYVVSKDKIKAKIEEVKDGTFDAKIVLQSLLEKE